MLSNSTSKPNKKKNNNMVKSRNLKKPMYKRKQNINMIHPHIELIQAEITTLTEELESINTIERELTTMEQAQKDVATACLEKYQVTLAKLNDTSMLNKLRSYNDTTLPKKSETQTLFLLQFFYIVRLGQLGLFDLIEMESPKSMLNAITDICDQLIGASVYHATDPSPTTKAQKRKQVFDILKKLETSSEDVIMGNITFKDINSLIQHIWKNTLNAEQVLENANVDESAAKEWAVLQFENMIQNDSNAEAVVQENDNDNEEVQQQESKEQQQQQPAKEEEGEQEKEEATVTQPQQQQSYEHEDQEPSVDNKPPVDNEPPVVNNKVDDLKNQDNNETSTADEWEKKDNGTEAPVVTGWDNNDTDKAPTVDGWDKKAPTVVVSEAPAMVSNSTNSQTPFKTTTKSNRKTHSRSSNESATTEKWDAKEKPGWNTIDNTVKGDAWDNSASKNASDNNWTSTATQEPQQNENNWTSPQTVGTVETPQQANTPSASPECVDHAQQKSNEPVYNSETSDNWRRRGIDDLNNSRGRGSSYRSSYRGSRGGKSRGTGGSGRGRGNSNNARVNTRGRGRGKGRGADLDEEQHSASPPQ